MWGSFKNYLKAYPKSRLIVIDTLQKVRTASKENAYANDYGDISLIKDFADRHSLAVVVVHHIRKQNDSDVFNKVSGTTGLRGVRTLPLYWKRKRVLPIPQGSTVSAGMWSIRNLRSVSVSAVGRLGGTQRSTAACRGKHTACSFSGSVFYAGKEKWSRHGNGTVNRLWRKRKPRPR